MNEDVAEGATIIPKLSKGSNQCLTLALPTSKTSSVGWRRYVGRDETNECRQECGEDTSKERNCSYESGETAELDATQTGGLALKKSSAGPGQWYSSSFKSMTP